MLQLTLIQRICENYLEFSISRRVHTKQPTAIRIAGWDFITSSDTTLGTCIVQYWYNALLIYEHDGSW